MLPSGPSSPIGIAELRVSVEAVTGAVAVRAEMSQTQARAAR